MLRRTIFLSALTIPPIFVISYLQRQYPDKGASNLPQRSQLHAISQSPPQGVRYPCLDVFETTVRKSEFTTQDYTQEVSYYMWTSYLIRTEAFLLGSKPLPGSPESISEGTKIANIVVCQSVQSSSYLFHFVIPKWLVNGFDYIADRGCPWRMLRGGYHEIVTAEEGDSVRIWWIIAHEYGINDGKILPWLGNWGHRLYAKALLDVAIRNLRGAGQKEL